MKLIKKIRIKVVTCHLYSGIFNFIFLYFARVQRKTYKGEIICRNRSGKDLISFSKYGFVSWEFANSFIAQRFVKRKKRIRRKTLGKLKKIWESANSFSAQCFVKRIREEPMLRGYIGGSSSHSMMMMLTMTYDLSWWSWLSWWSTAKRK